MKLAHFVLVGSLFAMGMAPVAVADHEDVVVDVPAPTDRECVGTPEENQTVGGQTVSTPPVTIWVEETEITIPSQSAQAPQTTVDPVSAGICVGE